MIIICLEEHFSSPDILAAWSKLDPASRGPAIGISTGSEIEQRLLDVADLRIAAMDEAGIDKAIISQTSAGVQNLPAKDSVVLARDANERIAEMMRRHPIDSADSRRFRLRHRMKQRAKSNAGSASSASTAR